MWHCGHQWNVGLGQAGQGPDQASTAVRQACILEGSDWHGHDWWVIYL